MFNIKFLKSFVALFLGLAFVIFPIRASAQVPPLLPFGGTAVLPVPVPCTCSGTVWTWFAPLFLSSVPVTGPMTYVPYATVPFANWLPTIFLTPHLGAYMAGVPACWVGVPPYCVLLPNIGVMTFVGTGLPSK